MVGNFTAIDFETANYQNNSACQLGIAVVNDWKIVAQQAWFIRPPMQYFTFTNVHGITYEQVRDKPIFAEIWPEVKPYIEQQVLAAHNAEFDTNVLVATLEHYRLKVPFFAAVDSIAVAKKEWPGLANYKLSTVAAHLNIELNHHEAASDAHACAQIILRAGRDNEEIKRASKIVWKQELDLFGGMY